MGDLLSSLLHRICVCFFLWLLYKQEQGKENKGQRQGIGKGKRESWRKTEDREQLSTPAIEVVPNSVWYYDGPQAQEKRKPQVPAPMLGYLQTWRTHLTSHFDIPGSLKKLQTKFTRLWASSITTVPYEFMDDDFSGFQFPIDSLGVTMQPPSPQPSVTDPNTASVPPPPPAAYLRDVANADAYLELDFPSNAQESGENEEESYDNLEAMQSLFHVRHGQRTGLELNLNCRRLQTLEPETCHRLRTRL
ncbi:hypothetical protein D6D24_04694 [Aureobasidium pullulans]|uniref:Uncharacterized protein n=1 Tax=Aureobasidium pullulans TaxID=5580 RepID=A0A4S8VV77_AURPU|nr:hypothetical protein D6D24_04694 [Aureobasidium pullulans]